MVVKALEAAHAVMTSGKCLLLKLIALRAMGVR